MHYSRLWCKLIAKRLSTEVFARMNSDRKSHEIDLDTIKSRTEVKGYWNLFGKES